MFQVLIWRARANAARYTIGPTSLTVEAEKDPWWIVDEARGLDSSRDENQQSRRRIS